MLRNIGIIVGREFTERVRKKSFIITTLLMPLLMVGLMVAPALVMEFAQGDTKRIAVIDRSGLVAESLESNSEVEFVVVDASLPVAEAQAQLDNCFGVLRIGEQVLTNPNEVTLYTESSTSMTLEMAITNRIEDILENKKLNSYNIDNLQAILDQIETDVSLQVIRTDKASDEAEEGGMQSSMVATIIGYILGFVLYMFLLIYGSMVMQSVIEEKNNRVLEVMVSSVKPFDLLMGKILGVASVALVQVVIWGVLVMVGSTVLLPMMLPEELVAGTAAMAETSQFDPEMVQVITMLTDGGYLMKIFVSLLLFVVGGFLFYAAMFAAIGSAVDNVQDAQQLQTPITLPIILALLMMMAVINDPTSKLAFWFSMIPFTSPIVMMARVPYDIPVWEIVLSLVVLYLSFTAMVWMAAKIYRVGIFMYGKKPSLKELWRWMKYN